MFNIGDEVIYERSADEVIFATVEKNYLVPYVTVVDSDGKRLYAPVNKVFKV